MPNRILKESLVRDARVDKLSAFEECTLYRLLLAVDDYGNMDARPGYLKSMLFPSKEGVEVRDVAAACAKLCEVGLITLYEVNGEEYLHCIGFAEEQKLRHPRERYPRPRQAPNVPTYGQERSREDVLEFLRNSVGREGGL